MVLGKMSTNRWPLFVNFLMHCCIPLATTLETPVLSSVVTIIAFFMSLLSFYTACFLGLGVWWSLGLFSSSLQKVFWVLDSSRLWKALGHRLMALLCYSFFLAFIYWPLEINVISFLRAVTSFSYFHYRNDDGWPASPCISILWSPSFFHGFFAPV